MATSMTSSTASTGAECLVLLVLRGLFVADERGRIIVTIAVWLKAIALVVQLLYKLTWTWVVTAILESESYERLTQWSAAFILAIGAVSVAALLFYVIALLRARRLCR